MARKHLCMKTLTVLIAVAALALVGIATSAPVSQPATVTQLQFDDALVQTGAMGVLIQSGKSTIVLDPDGNVTINAHKDLKLTANGDIILAAGQDLSATSERKLKVEAGQGATINGHENLKLIADRDITLAAGQDLSATSKRKLKVEAGQDATIGSGRNMTVRSRTRLNATSNGQVTVTGNTTELRALGTNTILGALIKLN